MFLKRFALLSGLVVSLSVFSGGPKIEAHYSSYQPANGPAVDLINQLTIRSKGLEVQFEKKDDFFREWEVTGNGYEGRVTLFVSKDRGIGWIFALGGDSLKAVIAKDYRAAASPGLISMTTNFVSGLFIVENHEAECNSRFSVYMLKNSWDADVEYTGPVALELQLSKPCEAGQWKASSGKLKMVQKVQVAAIFVAVMSNNIRHLMSELMPE